jgi:hypothetical protein
MSVTPWVNIRLWICFPRYAGNPQDVRSNSSSSSGRVRRFIWNGSSRCVCVCDRSVGVRSTGCLVSYRDMTDGADVSMSLDCLRVEVEDREIEEPRPLMNAADGVLLARHSELLRCMKEIEPLPLMIAADGIVARHGGLLRWMKEIVPPLLMGVRRERSAIVIMTARDILNRIASLQAGGCHRRRLFGWLMNEEMDGGAGGGPAGNIDSSIWREEIGKNNRLVNLAGRNRQLK